MAFKKPKNSRKNKRYPERSKDVPVTQEMLFEVRDELKADISALDHKFEARFKDIKGEFKGVDARFNETDAKFSKIDARFDKIDERFEKVDVRFESIEERLDRMEAMIHQIRLLVEEQNARNRIVLDGLTNLFARQERIEREVSEKCN